MFICLFQSSACESFDLNDELIRAHCVIGNVDDIENTRSPSGEQGTVSLPAPASLASSSAAPASSGASSGSASPVAVDSSRTLSVPVPTSAPRPSPPNSLTPAKEEAHAAVGTSSLIPPPPRLGDWERVRPSCFFISSLFPCLFLTIVPAFL